MKSKLFALCAIVGMMLMSAGTANAEPPDTVVVPDYIMITDPGHPDFGETGTVFYVIDLAGENWLAIFYDDPNAGEGGYGKAYESEVTLVP